MERRRRTAGPRSDCLPSGSGVAGGGGGGGDGAAAAAGEGAVGEAGG